MAENATPQHTPARQCRIRSRPGYGAGEGAALSPHLRAHAGTGIHCRTPDLLHQFLRTSRRNHLQIVVHDARTIDQNCPRILNLLRLHSHAISIHETHSNAKSVYDPFTLVDDHSFVHRFHYDEARGLLALDDPIGIHALAERFDEIWEASSPTVSATTIGL
jgi:hypothetical protein